MDWKKIAQGAAETGIGAITGGVGGAIGSGLSSVFGNIFGDGTPSQKDIMAWQEKMLQKQFDYNSREAQLNRDFQQSMMEKSQQWNSIGAQMQRAQAAGVNPFSLVNNSGYQSVGSSAMASGSQAAPASGMTPGIPASLDAQRFNLIAAAMQSISQSSLSQSQKNAIDTKLVAELRKTIAEGDIAAAEAKIKQLVANDRRLADFVTAFFVKAREEAESAAANTDYIKDLSDLVKQDKNLKFLQGKIKKEHWDLVEPLLGEYYQGVIDKNTAQTHLANEQAATEPYKRENLSAQAGLFSEQALTEESKRGLNKALDSFYSSEAKWQDMSNKVREKGLTKEEQLHVTSLTQQLEREGVITSFMQQQLEYAIKTNNWYAASQIMNMVSSVCASVGYAVGAVKIGQSLGKPKPITGFK